MNNKNSNKQNQTNEKTSKIFNLNNILSQITNFAAYIILLGSIIVLIYFSFIETLDIEIDWVTLGAFSGAAVMISWLNWNSFYNRQYEKVMDEDIEQNNEGKYSIHGRYYMAIKDYTDAELQEDINAFNKSYIEKWLSWVENKTGIPIESRTEAIMDENGKPKLDENGKPILIEVKGIKDRKYWGFKYPILMWRIKTHHYPESGYRTSMELMSLFSFQDSDLNKRDLKAANKFHIRRAVSKLLTSAAIITVGGSIVPTMIHGDIWGAILRLIIALGSLGLAVFMGAMNGVRGARLKLSTVEDVCQDLEKWRNTKPVIAPYNAPKTETQEVVITPLTTFTPQDGQPDEDNKPVQITSKIFDIPKIQK